MPTQLGVIDLGVVAIYLVATTLVGAWFRKGQKDIQSYFVGDREVHWLLVLVSIVATETSTVTFLSVPGTAFNPLGGDLTFLQLAFGYLVGRMVIAWVILPGFFQGNFISAYEVLRKRFDSRVQRCASLLFLVTRTLADGLRLFLTALLLQQFTGWSMPLSILVMGGLTVLYTYLGGMQAVLWTDCIQFFIYMLGALLAGWILLGEIPGGWSEFVQVGTEAGKFRLLNLDTNPAIPYTLWAGMIALSMRQKPWSRAGRAGGKWCGGAGAISFVSAYRGGAFCVGPIWIMEPSGRNTQRPGFWSFYCGETSDRPDRAGYCGGACGGDVDTFEFAQQFGQRRAC